MRRSFLQCALDHATKGRMRTRRSFLLQSGRWAAGTALAGAALPWVHAAEDNTLQLAIVGCGGRGTGAVGNALDSTGGPVKLVAMADLVPEKLAGSLQALTRRYASRIEVPRSRQFIGFDAYRHAMDCLRPGDVVLLTTHAAFRATHFEYAVRKGLHVFMEKSFAPDPGSAHRMLRLAEEAKRKNLKVGTGLMCRHSSARQALIQKIRDGALGQVELVRAYRMDSGSRMGPWKGGENELLWQIRHPYYFFWVSTGRFIDYLIHQVDECCWIKDSWPVSAHGLGGRVPNSTDCSQNYDTYAIEYTFADGTKAQVNARFIPKCHNDFATFVHGAKCAAQFSGNVHQPTVRIYKDQRIDNSLIVWRPPRETTSPYVEEWNALLNAIREDRPYNEVQRSVYSNLAAIMGRAAVHTGQIVTWEQVMKSDFRFCPNVDELTMESPAPVHADAQGRYLVPIPGEWKEI